MNEVIMMEKWIGFIAVVLSIIALVFATSPARTSKDKETISVSGNAELTFAPNKAEVVLALSKRAQKASVAQQAVRTAGNKAINALKNKGYSVETVSYSVQRREEYNPRTEKSEFKGYEASHVLKVSTNNTDAVGSIIDTAFANGVNEVRSIEFGLTDERKEEARRKALARAANDANAKADVLASSLKASLGKPVSITESSYRFVPFQTQQEKYVTADAGGAASSRVAPGEVTISAQVNVKYALT